MYVSRTDLCESYLMPYTQPINAHRKVIISYLSVCALCWISLEYEKLLFLFLLLIDFPQKSLCWTIVVMRKIILTAYGIKRDMNQFLWVIFISVFLLVVRGELYEMTLIFLRLDLLISFSIFVCCEHLLHFIFRQNWVRGDERHKQVSGKSICARII